MPHSSCCVRAQHKITMTGSGSLLTFAAQATKVRFGPFNYGRELQQSAGNGPNQEVKLSASLAGSRTPPFLAFFVPQAIGVLRQLHSCLKKNLNQL